MWTLQLWEASFIHKEKDLQSLKDQVWMISNWNWPNQKTSDVTIIFIKVWRTFEEHVQERAAYDCWFQTLVKNL